MSVHVFWPHHHVKKSIIQSLNLSSGRGSDTLDDGVGPPFDHTMADPAGHYLFVDVNEHEVGGGDSDDDDGSPFGHTDPTGQYFVVGVKVGTKIFRIQMLRKKRRT